MLKKTSIFFIFVLSLIRNLYCIDFETNIAAMNDVEVESEIELYDTETNQSFILDPTHSTNDSVRICVPALYPAWFTVPTTVIESMNVSDEKMIEREKYLFVSIRFSGNCIQLNSLLESAREIIYEEYYDSNPNERWRFPRIHVKLPKPWTWSKCAKCKLATNAFITLSIAGGAFAAGATGPGAIAVVKAIIAAKYGAAICEAVLAAGVSASVSEISKIICRAKKDCK